MTDRRSDELVRAALDEARRRDLAPTPAFKAMWARAAAAAAATGPVAPERHRPLWNRPFTMAAAALLLIALALGGILGLDPRRPTAVERATAAAGAISQWQAPLDFLLETPGREWLAATPDLGRPVLFTHWNPSDLELEPATDAPVAKEKPHES